MSRINGARGIAYMSIASGAPASPVAYVSDWLISIAQTWTEVTGIGAKCKEYVTGIPAVSGGFSGWYDDASSQAYVAARDGVPRSFYLYPDPGLDPGACFYGMIIPDFTVAGGVQDAVAVSCSWSAAGVILLSPADGDLQDEAYQDILDEAYGVMS